MVVGVVRVRQINQAVEKALNLISFKPKKRAFIKPNLSAPVKPDTGIVTDPKTVRALISFLRSHGTEEILIGESVPFGMNAEKCFEVSGFSKLAEEEKVEIIDLDKAERSIVNWKYGNVSIPDALFQRETCYINVPKIKTHIQTTVTFSLKNQKGLLLPEDKKRFHMLGLHEPLAELTRTVKPDLVVADGVVGLEGDGPGGRGKKVRLGLVVASDNPVEADATCCRIIGIDPEAVTHIKKACELGIGTLNPRVLGERIEEVKVNFLKPRSCNYKILNAYFWRTPKTCTGCSEAAAMAVSVSFKKPKYWPRLFVHGIVKRLDIIAGLGNKLPENQGKVICIGDCTRKLTEKSNLVWVKGCPPDPMEILKAI